MSAGGTRVLLLPALSFLVLVCGVPLVQVLTEAFGGSALSFDQFERILASDSYIRLFGRTLALAAIVTGVTLLLGYPTAYWLAGLRGRMAAAVLLAVIVPYLTSFLVRTYAWVVILADGGVANRLLSALGLTAEPLALIYNRGAVVIGMVHIMLPLMILPLYAAMRAIDPALLPAARSLGAGPLRAAATVLLPLTAGAVRSAATLVFVVSLGFYVTPIALGGPGDATVSGLIASQISDAADFGMAAALSTLLVLCVGLLAVLFLRDPSRDADEPASRRHRRTDALAPWLARKARDLPAGVALAIDRVCAVALPAAALAVLAFLVMPTVIVAVMSLSGSEMLQFPPATWSLRWYGHYLADSQWTGATIASLRIALAAAAIALLLGTAAAYVMANTLRERSARFFNLLFLLPLILPPVVLGVGLYRMFAALGWLGRDIGLVLSHSLLGLSYVVMILFTAFRAFDNRLILAAQSLGAGPSRTLRRIVLPIILPALLSAFFFAFLASFDEVVLASLLGGAQARTLPMKMWEDIRHTIDPTIAAVSTLLIILAGICAGTVNRSKMK